jgi:hypothetical protein
MSASRRKATCDQSAPRGESAIESTGRIAPPDPRDRRGKLIALTDRGKRLIDEAISRHVANQERLLLSLTEAEQETLDALLKKRIAAL